MSKTMDVMAKLTIGAGKTCYPCRLSKPGVFAVQRCAFFDESSPQAVDGQVVTYKRCPGCITVFGIEKES